MKLKPVCILTLSTLGLFSLTGGFAAETVKKSRPEIIAGDVRHDISRALMSLSSGERTVISNQAKTLHLQSKIPIQGFQGIGQGLGSYQVTSAQPNIAASVGLAQYVQWVDTDIAVFDKATGTVAPGFPAPGNTLWSGFGGVCENINLGDATVKYDQLAHRWVLSQHAFVDKNQGPFFQCIAVSTSEDAAGSYYRYAFQLDALNDDAKMGLWPDAYYMSFDMSGRTSNGPRICAFDRDKMLSGLPATMQCRQYTAADTSSLQPADLDGRVLPPAGTPEYFISLSPPQNLLLFKFHVDFSNPNNSTITNAISIPVDSFTKACTADGGDECAIQPFTPNKLNLVTDRLTRRLVYRQFFDHGSLLATHTIEGPPPKLAPALRWYELRIDPQPDANPVVYQQATQAPDSMNRFTGSMAIDHYGNMALGYTVTSSLVFPSLELSGRNYFDPLNVLNIQALFTGTASQVDNVHNWGNYSAMSVDPVDDCTFWYTNEYLSATGSFNWSTFIVNFKMAACL